MMLLQTSDHLSLSIDQRGTLRGVSSSGILTGDVSVRYDGRDWAKVPSKPLDGSTNRIFRCDLPPPPADGAPDGIASVVDIYGDTIASIAVPPRLPACNSAGVSAADILALHNRPFFGVPYMSFDGAKLTIVGSHLPPDGDPSALRVEFQPGVVFDFQYPLEAPGWESHFWYWPNAVFSDFLLTIDLAASAYGADPFSFRFKYSRGPQKNFPEPYGRVWIPRDFGTSIGFPHDGTQLTRVQTWSDTRSVSLTGYNAYHVIRDLLNRYGIRGDGATILDWGCGHGRVTRHFIREWPGANIIGMDIDAENIDWATNNLRKGKFVASPLLPPCQLADASVDAVFSISVMTHLPLDVQLLWLAELARIVRPGGIVLMSFGGPAAVAWSSVWNNENYFTKWREDGIHADKIDLALDGKIEDATYYRNTAQTHEHVTREWSKYFEIVDILPEAIGNLDFAVLRRGGKRTRNG
ncbi:class I SAM-dependent methyltransferase [Acidisoma silvae]|uniref:Class I SAM-dependent methyltransferase n=1 Tax=Acidisoma silvae TaxID=2802396 RepID=A0A963YMQ1_9PROT|nr:class I SAM-dependent methyltransferase [Acidisoma silvae]MCB8873613.1 class I SAM-dependent methyltransferase [Acidisoma silvae]